MQRLPPISNPNQYVGLFVIDFGDHVGVGFTAAEVELLRRVPDYSSCMAYQIYRVHEQGGFELRGVLDASLGQKEAICFLRESGADARGDFEAIRRAAEQEPLPVETELRLLRSYDFRPPDLTALIYPAYASHGISGWLQAAEIRAGDTVEAGPDVIRKVDAAGGMNIRTLTLNNNAPQDRSMEDLLLALDRPVQR